MITDGDDLHPKLRPEGNKLLWRGSPVREVGVAMKVRGNKHVRHQAPAGCPPSTLRCVRRPTVLVSFLVGGTAMTQRPQHQAMNPR